MEKLLLAVAVIILLAPSMTKADVELSAGLGGCESTQQTVCNAPQGYIVHLSAAYIHPINQDWSITGRWSHTSTVDRNEVNHLIDQHYDGSGSIDIVTVNIVYTFK